MNRWQERPAAVGVLLLASWASAAPRFYVSPAGSDTAAGTRASPFRTLHRAQQAVRAAAPAMDGDIVVDLAPGIYRLDRPLELTEADSGRNSHRVIYRSAAGPGQARLLGSALLVGWREFRDGIWRIDLPEGLQFDTLYENGRRAWKARFPNYEHHPDMPTARGRYLISENGSPTSKPGEKTGWLVYKPEDQPPTTAVRTMKIVLFAEGKCDWHRVVRTVASIDASARRVNIAGRFWRGVGARARYFYEDELAFLDAPGEFYLDSTRGALYYKPMASGHPDQLGIAAPLLSRLVQIQGRSRDACVENICLQGLALEETDGSPLTWWSAKWGKTDGALVWMNNARNIEVRACHLRNGGRSGIMMVGHNTDNVVRDCWIEHMGVNGVTLCNRFSPPPGASVNEDRCARNRVLNCRIDHVGEVHTYAACVNVFNASDNEVGYCELHDSVRYAVTVRGNTGAQYGPPVWTRQPPAKGNRFHHLHIFRCGQDGGDMGALHCASVNNPGGDCINTFEQITIADCRAIPSMHDIPPDGIFLDWPKMSMHQVFHDIHIVRVAGQQLRSNGPDNAASAVTENVSWKDGFRPDSMDYSHIGLTDDFPGAYGGRPAAQTPLPAPTGVVASATAYDSVTIRWQAPAHAAGVQPVYIVYRDSKPIGETTAQEFTDSGLTERTTCHYSVAARGGDFCPLSPHSAVQVVRTPPDETPPALTGARISVDRSYVRVTFSEPVDPAEAVAPENYRFDPMLTVTSVETLTSSSVRVVIDGARADTTYTLHVHGIRDTSAAHNAIAPNARIVLGQYRVVAEYRMDQTTPQRLRDASGGGGDAVLRGGVTVEPHGGPGGGPALCLDGRTGYAEAPADLDLGAGDFTIMLWLYRLGRGIALSKGNGFGSVHQWSVGWQKEGVPDSVSLRIDNHFLSTAPNSVPWARWVHVAFVKRGATCQAYVDGRASGPPYDMSGLGPLTNDRPLRIGRREHEPNPVFFRGKIAGVRLLRYALPSDEIRAQAGARGG